MYRGAGCETCVVKLLPPGKFCLFCFAVCTPFPISETEMSYKHGDNCSWHRFLFIFALEVLSDRRPFSLRIQLIFCLFVCVFEPSTAAEGGNKG